MNKHYHKLLLAFLCSSLEKNKVHYENHKQILISNDLRTSKFVHTNSQSIINDWDGYAPFLVKSLGIVNEEEKNKVFGLKYVDRELYSSSDFLINYAEGETFIHKYIKLFLFQDLDEKKFHLCYFTAKCEHTLSDHHRWKSMDHETLKYAIDFEISQVAYDLFHEFQ